MSLYLINTVFRFLECNVSNTFISRMEKGINVQSGEARIPTHACLTPNPMLNFAL